MKFTLLFSFCIPNEYLYTFLMVCRARILWKVLAISVGIVPFSSFASGNSCSLYSRLFNGIKYEVDLRSQKETLVAKNAITPAEQSVLDRLERDGGEGTVIELKSIYSGPKDIVDIIEPIHIKRTQNVTLAANLKIERRKTKDREIDELVWTQRLVKVTKPPKSALGGELVERFEEMKEHDVPVYITPVSGWKTGGSLTHFSGVLTDHPQAALMYQANPVMWSNLLSRHELTHVDDYIVNQDHFLDLLPKLPKKFQVIVEKLEKDIPLEDHEEVLVAKARKYTLAVAEIRASNQVLTAVLNPKQIFSTFLSPKLPLEAFHLYANLFNDGRYQFNRFRYGLSVAPGAASTYLSLPKAYLYLCAWTHASTAMYRGAKNTVNYLSENQKPQVKARELDLTTKFVLLAACGIL